MASPDPKSPESPVAPATSRVDVTGSHAASSTHPVVDSIHPPTTPTHNPAARRKWPWVVGLVLLVGAAAIGIPWLRDALTTVSTDDAYVNGHVTFVAPRVSGQVKRVLVDDNNMVHKGDLLAELDEEPFQVQVNIDKAAVIAAEADLVAAQASVRGNEGLTRSLRYGLQRAVEDVDDKVATLNLRVATLGSKKASLTKAQADYNRNKPLAATGAVTQQDMDAYTEAMLVAQAQVQESLQAVYEIRVALGLPPQPEKGQDLTQVPQDLNQNFSSVREAQAKLIQAASALGVTNSFNQTPRKLGRIFTSVIHRATSTRSTPNF